MKTTAANSSAPPFMNAAVRWAFSLFLFLLPWQTRWIFEVGRLNGGVWEYGTLSIYATEILLWVIVIASVAKQSRISPPPSMGGVRGGWQLPVTRYWLPVTSFITYLLLSSLWSPIPRLTLFAAIHFASAVLLLLFITRYNFSRSRKIVTPMAAFIAGALFQAILGLVQFASQQVSASTLLGISFHLPSALGASVIETADGRLLRAYGGLPHPNILGGYLAIALLLVIDLLFKAQEKKMRILLHFTSLILAAGLFVTFSRSAWLGLGVGLVVFLTRSHFFSIEKKRDRLFHLLPLTVAVIVFASISFSVLSPRLMGGTRLEEISRTERVSGIRESLAVIRSSPWLGVGFGNYTARLANLAPGRSSWSYQPVHNVPLLILAELGLFGFIILIFLISKLANLQTCKLLGTSPPVLAFITIALFDHYPWSLYPGLMLMALAGGLALIIPPGGKVAIPPGGKEAT